MSLRERFPKVARETIEAEYRYAKRLVSKVEKAQVALTEAMAEKEALEKATYAEAAAHGYVVITDGPTEAAAYYGLTYLLGQTASSLARAAPGTRVENNCDVVVGPNYGYGSMGGTSYAVVPKPGFEHLVVARPERERRERNVKKRAERRKVFERIRRMMGGKTT